MNLRSARETPLLLRFVDKTPLKGLVMLETLAIAEPAPRVMDELARRVGLTRSKAHRTLSTLMHAGYMQRGQTTGTYSPQGQIYF